MNPFVKSALTWLAVIALVALFFAGRYALVQGFFGDVPPTAPGPCRVIASGLKGAADLAVDAAHDAIFVAVTDRLAATPYSDPEDGLYLLKLDDPAAAPVKLAGTPPGIHPYAISLFSGTDGGLTLGVIDRRANGRHLIETYGVTFDGGTPKLSQQSTVQGGLLVSPHSLSGITPDRLYVSNDHVTSGALGRFAEDYLLWPHADVMAFNGMGFRIATQRIAFPAGVLVQGPTVYVAARNQRQIQAFSIDAFSGALNQTGALSLPARPDNISADAGGNLIVAAEAKPGSSQVFRVHLDASGVPQSYQTIFSDDGHVLSGASSAAIAKGQLFIGASADTKMLACLIKP